MKNDINSTSTGSDFTATAIRVSKIGIIGNVILTAFKLAAGIISRSQAMISDAIHSASDVFASFIVIIGVRISGKEADASHPYGHERYESVAALILAMILTATGLFLGRNALVSTQTGSVPGALALIAAIVSIVSKELMYRYTAHHAKKINSTALMAEAWHHRSDALSSIGALAGIAAARFGYPAADRIASLIICVFILKAAYDIFTDAIDKMVDHCCDEKTQNAMFICAASEPGVLSVESLTTRVFGSRIYVDIVICVDGTVTLAESHRIAENVHRKVEAEFPAVKHINVRVIPK